jgi:hypothetical protein
MPFRRNVDCESKSDDEIEESSPAPSSSSSTTESSSEEEEENGKSKKDPQTLEEVLAAIKEAGQSELCEFCKITNESRLG